MDDEIRLCTLEDIGAYNEAKKDPIYRTVSLPLPDEVDNLTMIVKVARDQFNFASCGSWDGPTEEATTFADVQLSFIGVSPSHPTLAADFTNAVRNLEEIMYRAREATRNTWPSAFKAKSAPDWAMRFDHQLFERQPEESPKEFRGTSRFHT